MSLTFSYNLRIWKTAIPGVDLALLPEYRNAGIGSYLLSETFNEAARTNRAFTFPNALAAGRQTNIGENK